MMLAPATYGVGRENATLSPQENEGIIIATSFIDTLPTEAAKSLRRRIQGLFGRERYVGEYGEYGYRGMMLWAEAVKKAGSAARRRDQGAGRHQYNGAGGLYTIDGQTNHTDRWTSISGSATRASSFDVVKSFSQRQPPTRRPSAICSKNPNDTKQYEPEL